MRGPEVITMALPYDQDWLWFSDVGDRGTVALAPHLDAAGRERALDELQAHWRRTLINATPDARDIPTQPMRLPAA